MRSLITCTHDAWYRTDRLFYALLAAGLVFLSGVQAYKAGEKSGYSDGWRDANCGVGNDCEGGQE